MAYKIHKIPYVSESLAVLHKQAKIRETCVSTNKFTIKAGLQLFPFNLKESLTKPRGR